MMETYFNSIQYFSSVSSINLLSAKDSDLSVVGETSLEYAKIKGEKATEGFLWQETLGNIWHKSGTGFGWP